MLRFMSTDWGYRFWVWFWGLFFFQRYLKSVKSVGFSWQVYTTAYTHIQYIYNKHGKTHFFMQKSKVSVNTMTVCQVGEQHVDMRSFGTEGSKVISCRLAEIEKQPRGGKYTQKKYLIKQDNSVAASIVMGIRLRACANNQCQNTVFHLRTERREITGG